MGMALYDLLQALRYDDKISVWRDTGYNQYILVFEGRRDDGVFNYQTEMFWHATDKVSELRIHGAWFVIILEDYPSRPAEELYSESYAKKWRLDRPETRPFLTGHELDLRMREMEKPGYQEDEDEP